MSNNVHPRHVNLSRPVDPRAALQTEKAMHRRKRKKRSRGAHWQELSSVWGGSAVSPMSSVVGASPLDERIG